MCHFCFAVFTLDLNRKCASLTVKLACETIFDAGKNIESYEPVVFLYRVCRPKTKRVFFLSFFIYLPKRLFLFKKIENVKISTKF